MRNADDRGTVDGALVGNVDGQQHRGRAAHHVLNRREGEALAAKLRLRGRGVRVLFEMGAGVHHQAELREQQRKRQHMNEPTAIASNQGASAGEYSRKGADRQPQLVASYASVTKPTHKLTFDSARQP